MACSISIAEDNDRVHSPTSLDMSHTIDPNPNGVSIRENAHHLKITNRKQENKWRPGAAGLVATVELMI